MSETSPRIGSAAAALLATSVRPRWWLLALGTFLVRGGIVLLLLPIVVLPTQAGLANLLSSMIVGFVFSGPSSGFVAVAFAAATAVIAWALLGGLAAAAMELQLAEEAATVTTDPDERSAAAGVTLGGAVRGLVVRLIAHLPTVAAVVWAAVPIGAATYAELVDPGDAAMPIVVRVITRVPGAVALVAACWLAGETVGGVAVRELRRSDTSVARALGRGWRSLLVAPWTLPIAALRTTAVLVAIVVAGFAARGAWLGLRVVIRDGDPLGFAVMLLLFGLVWIAGLWLVGFVAAWRAAAASLDGRMSAGPDRGATVLAP